MAAPSNSFTTVVPVASIPYYRGFDSPTGSLTVTESSLVDRFGRSIHYLRISVTDRCDFRCVYCMSEDMTFLPREQLLTLEEIDQIAAAFIELGVDRIRITGGEPLVRRNIVELFRELGRHDGLRDLTLTTNGSQLARYARDLREAGVTRVNISLDTLRADRFKAMTRVGDLGKTLQGIDAAIEAGFERVKLNSVILKGHNHDEVVDLVDFAVERGIDISFIEEMPLGDNGDHSVADVHYSSQQIREQLAERYSVQPSAERTGGPARYWRIDGYPGTRIGFISPHSHNFCDDCNRVRLTSEGLLLLCLGQEHSVDLRHVVRAWPGDRERLKQAIVDAMQIKPKGHEFDLKSNEVLVRHMNMTGG